MKPSVAVGLMLGAAALFHSCEADLLTGQPSWLGESIYDELSKDGNYKTTLSLIDDLGFHEQMSRRGSVTIFVADDDAFTEWFKTNSWGVRSYNQLTTAQKKQLLNRSMIKNAYLIELMSNVSSTPPEPGKAMRRHNSTSIFDSIYVMKHEDMNENLPAWAWYKQNKKDIILFKDGRMMSDEAASNCTEPMIHLLPAFLEKQAFTDEDMRILTNGRITSKNDAFVDGVKVIERDITCKNGYISKMSIGGVNCFHMFGISYWNDADGARLAKHIEQVYDSPGGKERYWDQVAFDYFPDKYQITVRECTFDDIAEIDTYKELCKIDPAYCVRG